MLDPGDLFVFIAALVAVYLLPGPDMALVLSASVFQGRRNGLMVAAGLALSRALHVSLAGIGLAALLKAHPILFDAVRWIGAIYLIWMAWKILRANKTNAGSDPLEGAAGWQALQRLPTSSTFEWVASSVCFVGAKDFPGHPDQINSTDPANSIKQNWVGLQERGQPDARQADMQSPRQRETGSNHEPISSPLENRCR